MKTGLGITLAALALLAGGCDSGIKSGRRLQLPQGSAENGRTAFVALKCVECHTVTGISGLPRPTAAPEKIVALGGEVARLRTIGDLLTAIIHPKLALSEKWETRPAGKAVKSPMPVVNDVMTVTQMIDLVTFLQPQYSKLPPPDDWNYTP